MMGVPELVVASMALGCAMAAGWFVVPSAPPLEGERWFKTLLARRLHREGWDAARLGPLLAYHPAGRLPERKVGHPGVEAVPGPPLPGEVELVTELAALPDLPARWERLHRDGAAELLAEPVPLSPDHLPSRWLGPGHGWDVSPEAARRAEQRLHATWAVVTLGQTRGAPDTTTSWMRFATPIRGEEGLDRPEVAAAVAQMAALVRGFEVLPFWGWRAVHVAAGLLGAGALKAVVEHVADELAARTRPDRPEQRLLVAGVGLGTPVLLRALAERVPVRDRVAGVLSVGGLIQGHPGAAGPLSAVAMRDWLDHHFRHERMDIEIVRLVPYAALQWFDPPCDPPGVPGVPLATARFPEPGFVGQEPPAIEAVDLGLLRAQSDVPMDAVVDTLRLTVALWALSRR